MVSVSFEVPPGNTRGSDQSKDGKGTSIKHSDKPMCPPVSPTTIIPRVIGTYSRVAAVLQPVPILPRHVPQSSFTPESQKTNRLIRPDVLRNHQPEPITGKFHHSAPVLFPTTHEDELIDVVNDSHLPTVNLRCSELSPSFRSLSPPSDNPSTASSPSSLPSPSSSNCPESLDAKRKVRTNYSPSQVQILEKAFYEDAYPDQQTMEKLSKQLDVAESKLKVWFQNKRARMRRRMNDQTHVHSVTPISPMYSPNIPPLISPYVIPPNHIISTPPRLGPPLMSYSPSPPTCSPPPTPSRTAAQPQIMSSPFQNTLQVSPYMYPFMYHHY